MPYHSQYSNPLADIYLFKAGHRNRGMTILDTAITPNIDDYYLQTNLEVLPQMSN